MEKPIDFVYGFLLLLMLQPGQPPSQLSQQDLPCLRLLMREYTASPARMTTTVNTIMVGRFINTLLKNQITYKINKCRAYPCHSALEYHHEQRIFPAKLPLNRGHRRNTRGIKKAEHQKRRCTHACHGSPNGSFAAEEDFQGGDYAFFGKKSCNLSGRESVVI